MDLLFLGAGITFGVSELSVVLVVFVVATKLELVSVILFSFSAVVSKIVVGVEPDGVLKSVADKFCINRLAVASEPKFLASFSSVNWENRDG